MILNSIYMDFNLCEDIYLIAEIGINHNGDISTAKQLIDAASAVGWDCVKFQKRNPDVCVPDKQKNIIRSTPWGEMTYLEYKKKIEFNKSEYDEISNYCSQKPRTLKWTASVWDMDSLDFMLEYDIPFLKIPSALITNLNLVKHVSKTGLPVIISTGMSSIEEIDSAVNEILKHGKKPCIMHCNSSYPAPLNELNLSLIPYLKDRYDCIVGYSGHEYNVEPSVIAATLGAKVIERHITIDQSLWGTDQKSSLTITGMHKLYMRVRDLKKMLGEPKKKITDSEKLVREKLRVE